MSNVGNVSYLLFIDRLFHTAAFHRNIAQELLRLQITPHTPRSKARGCELREPPLFASRVISRAE